MEWLQSHVIQIVAPLGVVALLGVAIKALPNILEKKVTAAIDGLFEKGDAADDAFIVAAIRWAEAKYGAGTGAVKANAVVEKITALLPIQYRLFVSDKARAKAVELFQKCFDRLEATVLKEVDEHKV